MKKGMLFLALVGCIILASTAIASATWGDGGTFAWSLTADNLAANMTGPHKGYTSSTEACGVCHAVHNAAPGEVLLSSTIANACDYCHVGEGLSYIQVYAGYDTWYQTDNNKNHSNHCTDCHAVHGANTINGSGILKATTSADGVAPAPVNRSVGTTYVPGGTVAATASQSEWCSTCHQYTDAMDGIGTGYDYYELAFNGRSHVMTDQIATYGNSVTSYSGGTVAWVGSQTCAHCHADKSQGTVGWKIPAAPKGAAFPHYTAGVRFLLTAAYNGGTTASASNSNDDGVCLRCHKNSAITGVGSEF